MAESEVLVVDPNMWAKMTVKERADYFHKLSLSRKTFILDGIRYEYDSNLGPISMSFGGSPTSPSKSSEPEK